MLSTTIPTTDSGVMPTAEELKEIKLELIDVIGKALVSDHSKGRVIDSLADALTDWFREYHATIAGGLAIQLKPEGAVCH